MPISISAIRMSDALCQSVKTGALYNEDCCIWFPICSLHVSEDMPEPTPTSNILELHGESKADPGPARRARVPRLKKKWDLFL